MTMDGHDAVTADAWFWHAHTAQKIDIIISKRSLLLRWSYQVTGPTLSFSSGASEFNVLPPNMT